jgi:hypothetical protein
MTPHTVSSLASAQLCSVEGCARRAPLTATGYERLGEGRAVKGQAAERRSGTRRSGARASDLISSAQSGQILIPSAASARPCAPPGSLARLRALTQALPFAWGGRAGVRPPQARVGAAPAESPWTGSGPAARRPDDPHEVVVRARPSASRTDRAVSSTLTGLHGKVVASCLAAAGLRLRSALPTLIPTWASDRVVARECFPQCSGTNAETPPPMIAAEFR